MSCLSAFISDEKKNPKYVNNANLHIAAPQDIEIVRWSYRLVLTIIPILLTLTVEGMRNDTCIASVLREGYKVDEKNLSVPPAWKV